MNKDFEFGIKKQLITKEELHKKVKELGEKITEDFKNENEPLIIVGLLKGSIVFMADLIRKAILINFFNRKIVELWDSPVI